MPRILLAEDFPDALDMYAEVLRAEGFDVVAVTDGASALEATERSDFDVVLLDIRMPGVVGTEVARRLKANPRFGTVPIVALTAYAFPHEHIAAIDAGFDVFIAKPCLPQKLIEAIQALLDESSPRPT